MIVPAVIVMLAGLALIWLAVVSWRERLPRNGWGQGYATEGARALVQHAFTDLGVTRIVATTMAVNTASRRVLAKAGLRYLRTVHLDWPDPLPGNEQGDVEYQLHRRDWRAPNCINPVCPTPLPG